MEQIRSLGENYDLPRIMDDFARAVMDKLIPGLKRQLSGYGEDFDSFKVELVLAVPPGRSENDYQAMRKAFARSPFSKPNIFMVSEPEAVFRSWVATGQTCLGGTPHWKVRITCLV